MEEFKLPSNEVDYDINYQEILISLLHDAHVISNTFNTYSDILSRAISGENKIDIQSLRDHVQKIIENGYILSLLLNKAEFEINPSYFENQVMAPDVNIFGKFWKATSNLKRIANKRKVHLLCSGANRTVLKLYPIIDLLPYLLIDNALKYSPKESNVNIHVYQLPAHILVSVSSYGPTLKPEEIEHVFEKGFRGYEASKMVSQGSGRGLAIAKHICDIHQAEIKVETGSEEFLVEGIPHSAFKVTMKFPRS